ncbi:MAG: hypothetical protein QG639_740 [Patescibacteria group bacterium]|nr:hypothetical protein [Patescibacteria group bacterium]
MTIPTPIKKVLALIGIGIAINFSYYSLLYIGFGGGIFWMLALLSYVLFAVFCFAELIGKHNKATTVLGIITAIPVALGLLGNLQSFYDSNYSPEALVRSGDIQGALKKYNKLIESGKHQYRLDRGRIYYGLSEYEKALADFEYLDQTADQQTKDLVSDLDLNDYLAITYLRVTDIERSLSTAKSSIFPENNRLIDGIYVEAGQPEVAVREVQSYLSTKETPLEDDYIRLANLMVKANRIPEALSTYSQAIEAETEFAKIYEGSNVYDSYVARGDYYLYVGNHEAALADYNRALENEGIRYGYQARASAYFLLGEYQQALADINYALGLIEEEESYIIKELTLTAMNKYEELPEVEQKILEFQAEKVITDIIKDDLFRLKSNKLFSSYSSLLSD